MSELDDDLWAFEAEPASEPRFRKLLQRSAQERRPDVSARAWQLRAESLEGAGRVDEAVSAWLEAGATHREDIGAPGPAEVAFRRALELAPHHRAALDGLALVLYEREAWTDLVALYRDRSSTLEDPGRRATLHLFVSEVLDEQLGDTSAALDEVLAAVRVLPEGLRLLSRLSDLGLRANRPEDVAIAIGDIMLRAEDPEVRAALCFQMAQLHLGPIPNRERALVHLKSALVELGEDPDRLEDLEDVSGVWERLDALGKRFSESSRDRRVAPPRVRLERELAQIYEHERQDHRRALMALARALAHSPEDRELQEELMRLGLMADDLERVAETFERVVAQTDNALLRSFLRLRLGHLYGQALRRPVEAVRVYTDLLADEPGHAEARRRLEPLLERLGRRDEQAHLLEGALTAAEGGERFRTLEKLERIYGQLGWTEDRERIENTIRIETGDAPVSETRFELEEGAEPRPEDTGSVPTSGFHLQPRVQRLEAALEGPAEAVARPAFVELTRILIDEREDFEQAEALAERGLERFPDESSLLELLEDVHRRQQRWDAVATLLRRRLEVADSVETRLAVRKALAQLFEAKLDDKVRALEVLTQADEEGPFDLEVSRERERLLLESMDWARLEKTLERRLAEVTDLRLSALTRTSLARLACDVHQDLDRAGLLLDDALRDAPREPDVLELAAEVAARRRQTERAVELYERLASRLEGPRAALAWVAAGGLSRSGRGDLERAEAANESALVCDPSCRPAVEALAEIARERRDWPRALAWLVRAAELSTEVRARADGLVEAGRIADEELGDDQKAFALFESALEVDPDRVDLYVRAAELSSPRDPGRAFERFREASHRTADPRRAAEWAERSGELAQAIGRDDEAIEAYRAALHHEPRRRTSLVRLSALLERRGAWSELHEVAATYLLWHRDAGGPEDQARAFLRMAKAKRGLEEWEAAARFARQAVEVEPSVEAHALWAEVLELDGRWFEAADVLRKLALHERDVARRVDALSRAGTLFWEQAGDPARAAVVLADALRLRPDDEELCERLAWCRHLSGDDLAAAEAHRNRALHLTGRARAEALRRAASWAWSQNRRTAGDLLRASLECELTVEAGFDLARLWEYDGEVEHAAPLLLAVGRTQAAAGRFGSAARAYREAAELAAFRCFDGPRASEACERLRALDPDGRWDVLHAWIADRRAESDEISAEQAARAWLEVLGPHAGHALALERIEQWLLRADRPRPAAFVRTLRTDDAQGPPLLEAPEGHFAGFAEPTDPLSQFLARHGAVVLEHVREGWRLPAPRRRIDPSALSDPLGPVLRRALRRLTDGTIDVYAVESADAPAVPVWVDGRGALGLDLDWLSSLPETDVAFHVGVAVGGSAPESLPWLAIDRVAFLESLLGVLPSAGAGAPFDEKRAKRRGRGLERTLSAEARADLAEALREGALVSARRARQHVHAKGVAAGLVGCLAWSTVRRQVRQLQLEGPVRPWWSDVVRFATGRAFLGWACGLAG